jgi:hypothetical protein
VAPLPPILVLCVDVARAQGLPGFLRSREPVPGVAAAAFVTTGEPRCRLPLAVFLILAVEFHRRLWRCA